MVERDFMLETNKNETGFNIEISSKDGKVSITSKSRWVPGSSLKIASNDDVSDEQLYAVCDVLDRLS